jgi:hypothetical protein
MTLEAFLTQLIPLNHGPHASIQHHNPLPQNGFDLILKGFLHPFFKQSKNFTLGNKR